MKYPLLVSNPANIFYLTNITVDPRDAWVLLTETATYFFTDARFKDILNNIAHSKKLSITNTPIIACEISSTQPMSASVQKILSVNASTTLYFEADNITVAELKILKSKITASFRPCSDDLSLMRQIKQKQEISKIRNACATIDACLADIAHLVRVGLTEYEIAFKLDSWLREKGFASAFPPIVAIDEHAAIPHFNTQLHGTKKITKNCIILIDAGAKVDGYCSDISRMFTIGSPSDAFMNDYHNLLEAQEKTIHELSSQKEYRDVDLFCRKQLATHQIEPYAHATGHGIGIEVHEKPYVGFNSKDLIKPGHVVTIEPGIYKEGLYGMRIEDTIYVNAEGNPEILTLFPKKLN